VVFQFFDFIVRSRYACVCAAVLLRRGNSASFAQLDAHGVVHLVWVIDSGRRARAGALSKATKTSPQVLNTSM